MAESPKRLAVTSPSAEDSESGGELLERHRLCRQAQQEEPGDHERDAGPLHADRALVHE